MAEGECMHMCVHVHVNANVHVHVQWYIGMCV